MSNILATHCSRTTRRMMGQKTVLCIQDGSDLNYNNLDQCEGLGSIGTNQTGAESRGLHLHSSFVEYCEQCLRWYCLRWRIEDWHRVMKSGCRIEHLAHKTVERLQRAIAINIVIAWRIMLMILLAREAPELSAEVLFSDVELRTLHVWTKKKD